MRAELLLDRLRTAEDATEWDSALLADADSYEAVSIVHRFLNSTQRSGSTVRSALEGLVDHAWEHILRVHAQIKETPHV